ncbi:MAG TPA: GNAT family N-acetyltransferase [Kofleriaceae bacterium]|nr:GNAT family N-acetyltransferase [Kofleriaceae bacterium]
MGPLRLQLEIMDPYAARAETLWRDLERDARPAYFLTWGWIENWLAVLPREDAPALAVIHRGGEIAGACFLGRRTVLRHHVLPSRAVFVNATGVERQDELCIEHNGLLGAGCSLGELIELLPGDWDELFLPAVDLDAFRDAGREAGREAPREAPRDAGRELRVPAGYRARITRTCPAPFVDLARVRAAGDYLAVVSANTRAQIRRARRRLGACELEVAAALPDALAIYDELIALHTACWRARGQPGAFADPWFARFHRRLIERRFAHGEIQLVRLRAADGATVGCLYNLIAGGRVLFYQSGLAAFDDPAVKPGLVCHAAAIARCAADGHAVYDLLGGAGRYKAQLATGATELAWLCVQRARLRFAIEDRVRDLKQAMAETF